MADDKNPPKSRVNEGIGFKVSLLPSETNAPSPAARLRLFYFVLALGVGIVIIANLALWFVVYSRQAQISAKAAELGSLDSKIAALNASYSEARKEQDKITAIGGLLGTHVYASNVFSLLERQTLPQVSWDTLNFTSSGAMTLSGVASDYDSISAQVYALKNDPSVASISFSGINGDFDEKNILKGVKFNMNIMLRPQALNNAAKQ